MKFQHENDYLKVLLDACLNVKAHPNVKFGICVNLILSFEDSILLEQVLCDLENIRDIIFKEWPNYSGDIRYPVPSLFPLISSENLYYHTDNMWIGEYGDLRKELLQFMIDSLKLALKTK